MHAREAGARFVHDAGRDGARVKERELLEGKIADDRERNRRQRLPLTVVGFAFRPARGDAVLVRDGPVYLHIALIVARQRLDDGLVIVLDRRSRGRGVGQRQQARIREEVLGHGVLDGHEVLIDRAADGLVERREAVLRIVELRYGGAEVGVTGQWRNAGVRRAAGGGGIAAPCIQRHVGRPNAGRWLAIGFVIGEEEQLLMQERHRAAKRTVVLVLRVLTAGRKGLAWQNTLVLEEIGVHQVVLKVVVRAAVILVRAALGNHRNLRRAITVLGGRHIRDDRHFLHRFRRNVVCRRAVAVGEVGAGIHDADAVNGEVGGIGSVAIHIGQRGKALHTFAGVVGAALARAIPLVAVGHGAAWNQLR